MGNDRHAILVTQTHDPEDFVARFRKHDRIRQLRCMKCLAVTVLLPDACGAGHAPTQPSVEFFNQRFTCRLGRVQGPTPLVVLLDTA